MSGYGMPYLVMRVKRAAMMKILSNTARDISNLWKGSLKSLLLMMMTVTVFPGIKKWLRAFLTE